MSILRLTFRRPTVTIRVLHTMKVAAQAMCHINRPRTSLAFVHSLPSTSMPAARVPIISKTAVTCLLQPCLVDRSHISTAVVQLPMRVGPLDGAPAHISGESCAPNDGHYIADTPLQYVPTDGCHRWKDSCPVSPGLDAIHNFMNNTSDDCTRALLRTRLGECGACGPQ